MSDLVKRLRDWLHVYPEDRDKPAGHLYEEAADRIEELEERLEAAQDDAKEAEAYAGEMEAVLENIKAKLVKAVEALEKLEYWFDTDQEVLDAMTPDERADHMRQLQMIRDALISGPSY